MHLIDFMAYTTACYTIGVVLLFMVSWFVKSSSKVWDRLLWPCVILAGVMVLFGWIVKTIGWDPILW